MGKPVVHWEFWSQEPETVSKFYETVFEWKINHIPEMDYRLVDTGGEAGINGGIMKPKDGELPGNMAFYIDVDDIDTYVGKIKEAGGKMIVDKMEVPNVGWFALFKDPDDRVIGIWKQNPNQPPKC